MSDSLLKLYKTKQTVFNFAEIALITGKTKQANLVSILQYHIKKGELLRLRKGIYAKPDYDNYELAGKIYTPAYIGFETVLRDEGVIFQHSESIFVASYLTREITCLNQKKIVFRKLKNTLLLNPRGLIQKGNYFIAGKERAFLDMIYLNGNYYFDNLREIDFDKCTELIEIYDNKQMYQKLNSYKKNA